MIVYLLLNTANGKAYVGQSKHNDLSKRWNKRFGGGKGRLFAHAIAKYGAKSFTREILCCCADQEECDVMERLWIAILRSWHPKYGYNATFGGKTWLGVHGRATRRKISQAALQRWSRMTDRERKRFAQQIKEIRASRTAKEVKAFSNLMRSIWRSRTKTERKKIAKKISKAMSGRQISEATRQAIRRGRLRILRQKLDGGKGSAKRKSARNPKATRKKRGRK